MLICELMTPNPICCSPETPLRRVAQLMKENDFGALPVCREGHVVGVVTDRDLVTRGFVAQGDPSLLPVSEVMTRNLVLVNDDDRVERAVELMESRKVRRLPVTRDGLLVGMISITDLADHLPERKAGELLREVSEMPRRARAGV
jgi:CBS domain-containing protein